LDSGLQALFAGGTHKGRRRFVSSLRRRLVHADVTRAEFPVGGGGEEVAGTKTLGVQLILETSGISATGPGNSRIIRVRRAGLFKKGARTKGLE
jgi:hypothetical protein